MLICSDCCAATCFPVAPGRGAVYTQLVFSKTCSPSSDIKANGLGYENSIRRRQMELNFFLAICVAVFSLSDGYAILNSVSWAITGDDEGELETASNEEAAPALLGDTSSIWKQAFPTSVHDADVGKRSEPPLETGDLKQGSASPRMFSYRVEGVKPTTGAPPPPPPSEDIARTARYIAHYSDLGFLATISTVDRIKGKPFGNIFTVSDGPTDNSTGVPYFYVTPMDSTVINLRSNPFVSLTFSDGKRNFCGETTYDQEEPKCATLTLTGQMEDVGPEEVEFAREAMFSRHPVLKKLPAEHKWFFMKLSLEQAWLQDWMGGVLLIPLDEYLKAAPY
ncbi:hypothetical protein AGOR_G00066080 [Albula goreensis]|uniref:CREG-like beta-barrel domain-containing protein n=1 Tax=Albula goreensis TaxID=1534307 RepID=A0A8T3DV68_9TELE|nr:hypothetical protein AGOR_G00066080 [Albula goreensis]